MELSPSFRQAWLCSVLVALAAAPALPQTSAERRAEEYAKKKQQELFAASQRHLQIGAWCRKQGLVPQATTQFLRAVEVGEGRNPGAKTVLDLMRGLGDAFWRGERKKPSRELLASFERKVADAERRSRGARLELAQLAAAIHRDDEVKAQCLAALRFGGELSFDAAGKAQLDGAAVRVDVARWLHEQTVAVNDGQQRAFDPAASAVVLGDLHEHRCERVVVRTELGAAAAAELHALVTALLPHLEERLDGRPARPLGLFVFGTRAAYASYLERLHMAEWAFAPGLADYNTFQTIVCAEGLPPADVHALVLHELTHLFFYGVAPAVMPDWYAEGLAETFGGQGTFAWDGGVLQVGGAMRRDRIDAAKKSPLPLRELLGADAFRLLAADRDQGLRFYAQAWALLRFLRQDGGKWKARFEQWEANCRGAVLGAGQAGGSEASVGEAGARRGVPTDASALFARLLGDDLDELERDFGAWFAAL